MKAKADRFLDSSMVQSGERECSLDRTCGYILTAANCQLFLFGLDLRIPTKKNIFHISFALHGDYFSSEIF